MERDSMVFYASFLEGILELPEELQLEAFKAVIFYGIAGEEYQGNGLVNIVYKMAKPQIDANIKKSTSGKKGGRPNQKPMVSESETYGYESEKPMVMKKKTIGYESQNHRLQNQKPNVNVNDNVNVNENVNVNANVNDNVIKSIVKNNNIGVVGGSGGSEQAHTHTKSKVTRFVPPTLDDVKGYCQEKGYSIDCERFIDFYTAKNWMIGKNKMKDWKAALRNWVRQDNARRDNSSASGTGRDGSSNIAAGYKDALDRMLRESGNVMYGGE